MGQKVGDPWVGRQERCLADRACLLVQQSPEDRRAGLEEGLRVAGLWVDFLGDLPVQLNQEGLMGAVLWVEDLLEHLILKLDKAPSPTTALPSPARVATSTVSSRGRARNHSSNSVSNRFRSDGVVHRVRRIAQ